MNKTAYIVGSGSAGVAAAKALLEREYQVIMLDYANTLSSDKEQQIAHIANTSVDSWTEKLLSPLKYPMNKNFPDKLIYADDYPYRDGINKLSIKLDNCGLLPSLAQGGLSNVWGAATLPFHNRDLMAWPLASEDLAKYYTKVAEFVPIAANLDNLIHEYPIYGNLQPYNLAPQIAAFKDLLTDNLSYCTQQNFIFGDARFACNKNQCNNCGLCMRGCPYKLIYRSSDTLNDLLQVQNFQYIPDILVETFNTTCDKIEIIAKTRNGKAINYVADKLFIAAGVLSTAKIVLNSLNYNKPIKLYETSYFIAPFFTYSSKIKADLKKGHTTLTQLFIELNDPKISANTIHLQIYPYNEMLLERIKQMFGKLYFLFAPFVKWLLAKTVIIQGFLHSNDGIPINIQLLDKKLHVKGCSVLFQDKINLILKKFKKFGIAYGIQKSIPGRSFRCGGSFPMVEDVNQYNGIAVNKDGLLKGTNNVYIVDASVFPSIPAQTITYTVMANAYRIGSLA